MPQNTLDLQIFKFQLLSCSCSETVKIEQSRIGNRMVWSGFFRLAKFCHQHMLSYYSLSTKEKTCVARFKPLLDSSQWLLYDGLDYVLDVATRKMRKGRQKKKLFRNKMDDLEKGYVNDMYNSSDFDHVKNKVYCSVYHGEGHTMDRHKDGPKRNRRARGAVSRNRRLGTTEIIEVTHTNSMEIIFSLICTNIICCICN
jgi:hypothetical protein